ncbi:proton-conducting transporter membrane subunit [Mesoaciditoga lauensis]|uniref:proton-conducting transporter transmembrane domain-containing protein n=1 Tax=Mesoaciditoga lauensis TaxID=1495039 RepID=UPI00056AD565|nr:proton-conducting transporter membrane subunit [Mesoaciditoga lauensis]
MNIFNNAALLIGVPLLFAFSIPLFGLISKELAKWVTLLTIGFNATFSLYILLAHKYPAIVVMGNWLPPFGENLYIGPVAALLVSVISVIGLLIAIYNLWAIKRGDVIRFSILFLMFTAGASGMVLTGDIFNLFIFMEITGISSYALAAFGPERRALGGSFKFLVVSSIGSTLYLMGVTLIYTQLGTLNIAEIAARINQTTPALLTFAGILIISGLAVEAELFPFNGWVPDTYTGAINGVSASLSGIAAVSAVYALFRIAMTVFGRSGGAYVTTYGKIDFMTVIAILATATVVIGELSALSQKNVKKMLAYSSMAQMGLIAVGLSIGNELGVYGGIFQLINHSIAKSMLFLIVGILVAAGVGENIDDFKGLWNRNPFLALTFSVGAFSMLGFPLFGGFWSKFAIVAASVQRGGWYDFVIGLVLFASVVEAFYYLRIVAYMFMSDTKQAKIKTPLIPAIPIFILAVSIVAIGVLPQLVGTFSAQAAGEFTHKMSGYVLNVIPTIVAH